MTFTVTGTGLSRAFFHIPTTTRNENTVQKLITNISIFTIDKSARKCGAALNYITFLKGAFTCNCGKLPYWTLIKLLLKNVKKTIFASRDEFFNELRLASGAPLSDTVKCKTPLQ